MDGSISDADLSPVKASKPAEVTDNRFQQAIAAWKDISLTTLVSSLDTAASELVANQRDSLIQRKELAQKTKDFKKLDDAGKLAETKGLLKAYQAFIDLLTNQSKSTSSAFFQLYSALSEAPDPYPLLEASVDSLVLSEETLPKLTAENSQLQKQVDKLSRQLESAEQRLNQESSTRKALEEAKDVKLKEVEESWTAVLREKEDNWTAKEHALEEKVEHQDRLLKELKASLEVSQRLGHREDDDDNGQNSKAAAAELELITSELDRANNRLAEVEGRNEHLRLELAQSASQARKTVVVEDEPEYMYLQSENSALLRKLETAKFDKESEERRLRFEMHGLERELSSVKADCGLMKERMKKISDYDEVKKELEVLRAIEFATGSDFPDQGDGDDKSQTDDGAGESKDSLEKLLLARNKKLNDELTVLRVSHQNLKKRLDGLQNDLASTNVELDKSRALASTLESDLFKFQEGASNALSSSAAMSVAGSRYAPSVYGGRRGKVSPTSSVVSGFDPSGMNRNDATSGGNAGILPMITAQRDRFKKRTAELETELSKSRQSISSLRSEIGSLQKDNINLYEKSRYVSTYSRSQNPQQSRSAAFANPSTVKMPPSDTTANNNSYLSPSSFFSSAPSPSHLDRYKAAYEQKISPFAAFRGRESARVFRRMMWPERTAYRIIKMAVATRTNRNIFAGYITVLHIAMFLMLLKGDTCGGAISSGYGDNGGYLEDE